VEIILINTIVVEVLYHVVFSHHWVEFWFWLRVLIILSSVSVLGGLLGKTFLSISPVHGQCAFGFDLFFIFEH
jgi:hypothetical protein